MLNLLLVAALAASALGTPTVSLLGSLDSLGDKGTRSVSDAPYTVSLQRANRNVGTAAIISNKFAVAASSLIQDASASELSIRPVVSSILLNRLGKAVRVSRVHSKLGVSVLELEQSVDGTVAQLASEALPGSRAAVLRWSLLIGLLPSVRSDNAWLVLPRYCGDLDALCVAGKTPTGAMLTIDGRLVGLAGKQAASNDLASYVSLTQPDVLNFINDLLENGGDKPDQPDEDVTTVQPDDATTIKPRPTRPTRPTTPAAPTTRSPPISGKSCKININGGLPNPQPILVRDEEVLAFHDPDAGKAVTLAGGETVLLACPGRGNYFKTYKSTRKAEVVAECVSGDSFLVDGKSVELHQLNCNSAAGHDAIRAGKCADGRYTRINVGFQLNAGFLVQYENCFNEKSFDAIYSRMNMTPAIAGHESGVKRPKFSPGDFYEGMNVNGLYNQNNQREVIGDLLGDAALGSQYVSQKGDMFLARGHLTAKADYILGSQQKATFYYMNAAPQWQSFNGGNWNNLEDSVRNFVIEKSITATIITGTWGVATLPHKSGNETAIYLSSSNNFLRVPKYYWKVLYHPDTKKGVVFVGMNNPHHTTVPEDVFCKDVCNQYSWLRWTAKDQTRGYGFCCDVNEFRKVVDTVPSDIVVEGLL